MFFTVMSMVLLFLFGFWFTSRTFKFFRRDEFSWDFKPADIESTKTAKQLLRFAHKYSDGSYSFSFPYKNDEILIVDEKRRKVFGLAATPEFIGDARTVHLGKAAKIAGMVEWAENPNIILKIFRAVFNFLWTYILIALYFIVVAFILLPLFDSNAFELESIGFLANLLILCMTFHGAYLLKEFIVYIRQNIYSMKMVKESGLTSEEAGVIRKYLWLSFAGYAVLSILKLPVIFAVSAVINHYGV